MKDTSKGKPTPARTLLERKSWKPLPPVAVLSGDADFFKSRIVKRFQEELFGKGPAELRRYAGPGSARGGEEVPIAAVLDDLQTPSFFSPHRLVIVERSATFLTANAETLAPHFARGFNGGHLLLVLEGKLDQRTRAAKALADSPSWVVDCAQPYDRPPPWDTRTPAWDSDLTRWVVAQAGEKGLEIAPPVAFFLHERAGTDLQALDEELEKLATLLASRGTGKVDEQAVLESVGDLKEDSVFQAVELLLEGKGVEALEVVHRVFTRGLHQEKGGVTTEPTGIALVFLGTLLPRLRALRRAHALTAEGAGPDEWLAAGLVQKPFLGRFERALRACSPRKLIRLIDRLYDIDRAIKTGSPALHQIEILVAEFGAAG